VTKPLFNALRADRDAKRARTNSGTRPLSSVNDTLESLDMFGQEKIEDGQVREQQQRHVVCIVCKQ
jgi:hypothetical protein